MNAVGVGAFFNLLNFGQMYSYHILLLPAAVVLLVVAHVLLVRKHGVVPPFELTDRLAAPDGSPTDVAAVSAPGAAASQVSATSSGDGNPAAPDEPSS
jgi:hypothetical protein